MIANFIFNQFGSWRNSWDPKKTAAFNTSSFFFLSYLRSGVDGFFKIHFVLDDFTLFVGRLWFILFNILRFVESYFVFLAGNGAHFGHKCT